MSERCETDKTPQAKANATDKFNSIARHNQRHCLFDNAATTNQAIFSAIFNSLLVEYLREKRQQDPLALLQDDLIGDEGQIIIFNLTPNFEMAFYLAQLTGSFLFTDNRYRWNEMLGADHQDSNENWVGAGTSY